MDKFVHDITITRWWTIFRVYMLILSCKSRTRRYRVQKYCRTNERFVSGITILTALYWTVQHMIRILWHWKYRSVHFSCQVKMIWVMERSYRLEIWKSKSWRTPFPEWWFPSSAPIPHQFAMKVYVDTWIYVMRKVRKYGIYWGLCRNIEIWNRSACYDT